MNFLLLVTILACAWIFRRPIGIFVLFLGGALVTLFFITLSALAFLIALLSGRSRSQVRFIRRRERSPFNQRSANKKEIIIDVRPEPERKHTSKALRS